MIEGLPALTRNLIEKLNAVYANGSINDISDECYDDLKMSAVRLLEMLTADSEIVCAENVSDTCTIIVRLDEINNCNQDRFNFEGLLWKPYIPFIKTNNASISSSDANVLVESLISHCDKYIDEIMKSYTLDILQSTSSSSSRAVLYFAQRISASIVLLADKLSLEIITDGFEVIFYLRGILVCLAKKIFAVNDDISVPFSDMCSKIIRKATCKHLFEDNLLYIAIKAVNEKYKQVSTGVPTKAHKYPKVMYVKVGMVYTCWAAVENINDAEETALNRNAETETSKSVCGYISVCLPIMSCIIMSHHGEINDQSVRDLIIIGARAVSSFLLASLDITAADMVLLHLLGLCCASANKVPSVIARFIYACCLAHSSPEYQLHLSRKMWTVFLIASNSSNHAACVMGTIYTIRDTFCIVNDEVAIQLLICIMESVCRPHRIISSSSLPCNFRSNISTAFELLLQHLPAHHLATKNEKCKHILNDFMVLALDSIKSKSFHRTDGCNKLNASLGVCILLNFNSQDVCVSSKFEVSHTQQLTEWIVSICSYLSDLFSCTTSIEQLNLPAVKSLLTATHRLFLALHSAFQVKVNVLLNAILAVASVGLKLSSMAEANRLNRKRKASNSAVRGTSVSTIDAIILHSCQVTCDLVMLIKADNRISQNSSDHLYIQTILNSVSTMICASDRSIQWLMIYRFVTCTTLTAFAGLEGLPEVFSRLISCRRKQITGAYYSSKQQIVRHELIRNVAPEYL